VTDIFAGRPGDGVAAGAIGDATHIEGGRGRRTSVRQKLGRSGVAALIVIGLLVAMGLLAPVLPLPDPAKTGLADRFAGPSGRHLLGTDSNGRDLLSWMVWGARSSLFGPLIVTFFATVVGTALALFASWRGGWVDTVLSRVFDIVFAFPGILLALIAAAVLSSGQTAAVIALSIAYLPYVARIVRSAALQQVEQPYVSALWVQGQSGWRIASRHILGNLSGLVLAQTTLTFGYSMIDLAALSFLGVGASQNTPDWGVMVAGGQSSIIQGHPQQSLFGGAMLFIAVLAFSVLGERLGGSTRRWQRRAG